MDHEFPGPIHRLLIVDDVPTVREGLHWLFDDQPDMHIIGEAGDGIEALRLAGELSPDLVILDIQLPVMDGYAVTRSLKALPRPPVVILLTVNSDQPSRVRGFEAGCDGFVEKSAGWEELISVVRQALVR
jgi:DNA-binding NarL/FixJ family response regulator